MIYLSDLRLLNKCLKKKYKNKANFAHTKTWKMEIGDNNKIL